MRRFLSTRLRLDRLEPREVPANVPLIALGADAGATPRVRVLERDTGEVRFDFLAFNSSFRGGVRVAVGDVTGDGQDDIIAGSGPGGNPVVKVYDGMDGELVKRIRVPAPPVFGPRIFQQFGPGRDSYRGGITVAAADTNGDGRAEVITGSDPGRAPMVAIFDGLTGRRVGTFLAASGFNRAGVRVAAGDLDGDDRAEIITAPASGFSADVRVFDGRTHRFELGFRAIFFPNANGAHVAAADVDGDGQGEIVVGAGSGSRVEVRDGRTGDLRSTIADAIPGAKGVRVGGALMSDDGQADFLVGAANSSDWAALEGDGTRLADETASGFSRGLWVAASPEQAAINRHAAQVVLDWNTAALNAIRAERTAPPIASRALAILQTAVFDSVNGIADGYKHYLVRPGSTNDPSMRAAAIQAAHTVVTALFPTQSASFNALRTTGLASIADGPTKTAGINWGQSVADQILDARADDGSSANPPYAPGTDPGDWQPTPPANAPALLPGWGDVTPFGINNVNPFLPDGPPDLSSQQWANEFNEVKRLGSKTGSDRTPEQTEIATFWADGAGTFTPPGHWNAIAGQLAQEDGLSLLQTARLFAHLNIAEADAAIVCWEAKYDYNFWRPVTAIRNGDTDGNDQTVADPTWEPLLITPPFPDHTSGHSTFSGAASAILAAYFGSDRAFSTQGDSGLVTRSFTSFEQAAEEAGMSRIFGGIHYQSANQLGLSSGREIAAHVLAHVLESR
jgi:hypothetical protein